MVSFIDVQGRCGGWSYLSDNDPKVLAYVY